MLKFLRRLFQKEHNIQARDIYSMLAATREAAEAGNPTTFWHEFKDDKGRTVGKVKVYFEPERRRPNSE